MNINSFKGVHTFKLLYNDAYTNKQKEKVQMKKDVNQVYRDQLADMDLIHNGEIVDVDPRGGKGAKNDFLQRLKKGMVREKTDYGNNSEAFREDHVDDALSIMHADEELTAWAQQFKSGKISLKEM